jgi:hypothetical protein
MKGNRELTPMLCPSSLAKGTFLDGREVDWPAARSFRETFVEPRNLTT